MFIIVFNNETIKTMVSMIRKKRTKMYLASFGFQIQNEKLTHSYTYYSRYTLYVIKIVEVIRTFLQRKEGE